MSAPIIQSITPFDALQEYPFTFTWRGFQPRKNRLVIRENNSNEIVYDEIVVATALRHTLPSVTLENGGMYNAEITLYDTNDNPSTTSQRIVFFCRTTPLFAFSNIHDNDIIDNSYFGFVIQYSQPEGELLNTHTVELYNYGQQMIYSSGTKLSTDLTTNITGLEDNAQYYIRAVGETVNHISLSTGYIPFMCRYITPSSFSFVILDTNEEEASVTVTSNIISLEGHADGDIEYIGNTMIDLSSNDTSVVFDEVFSLHGDFTLELLGS